MHVRMYVYTHITYTYILLHAYLYVYVCVCVMHMYIYILHIINKCIIYPSMTSFEGCPFIAAFLLTLWTHPPSNVVGLQPLQLHLVGQSATDFRLVVTCMESHGN